MKLKIDKFSLEVGLFLILVSSILLIFNNQTNFITAQPTGKKNEKNTGVEDLTTIKTKINLNNIDINNSHDRLKIIGYLNGEGQTTYVDLKKIKIR